MRSSDATWLLAPLEAGGQVKLGAPVVVIVLAGQARLVGLDLQLEGVDCESRAITAAEAVLGVRADVVERASGIEGVFAELDREERPPDSRGPVVREMVVVTQAD